MSEFGLPLLCLLSMALVACSGSKDAGPEGGAEAGPPIPVRVAKVTRETVHHRIQAEAVLYPIVQANITPKINAPVQRFLVQRGDHVQQGQLLAVLENRDLKAAAEESEELYDQAQASYQNTSAATMPEDLTKAKTDVETSRQALDAAKKVYQSRDALFREGALAQRLVEEAKVAMVQAQSQYDTARQHLTSLETVGRREQLKSAEAQMQAAKAHYASAEAQLSYTEIRSPIAGVVADRPLNMGEMATSGSALITVVDISQLVARANIPVPEAGAIRVGRPVTISGESATLKGKVTVVSPAVDPSTTTLQVWLQAPNPGERLKPGTSVHLSIDADDIPNAIVVPVGALLSTEDGGEKVMIAGSDSRAHERKVRVGIRDGENAQILSGLQEGEQVIIEGALGLDDKAKIEIAKAEPEAAGGDDSKDEK